MENQLKKFIRGKHLNRAVWLLSVFMYSQFLFAQNLEIKGIVTDAAGEPVVGANVVEKGAANGVVTDADGNFILNVSRNAILVMLILK
ncbi:MAG: carboxypeptidase-like regulatory domain-containing protein [Tannerella sp.]|jgi:hypothetical protein|nr:carboxypeptidase-like regulatory domain-containing protein [Tannerella sp.]